MNNKEYEVCIQQKIDELEDLRKKYIKLASSIIGNTLLAHDLYYCSIINRAVQIIDGAGYLLKSRNLICISALVRLQIDNCTRTVAPLIAMDEREVFNAVIDGNPIDKIKDKKGKRMIDSRLVDFLAQYDNRIKEVYNQTSGAIHFSEKGFYASVSVSANTEYDILVNVGHPLDEKCNEPLIECAEALCHYIRFHQKLLALEAEWKTNFEKDLEA